MTNTHLNRFLGVVVAAALSLTLIGCGVTSKNASDKSDSSFETTSEKSETHSGKNSSSSSSKTLSEKQLVSLLPTVQDMPDGYELTSSNGSFVSPDSSDSEEGQEFDRALKEACPEGID